MCPALVPDPQNRERNQTVCFKPLSFRVIYYVINSNSNNFQASPARVSKPRPMAKSGRPHVSVNNVLMEHSHTHFLKMYLLWMLSHYSGTAEELQQRPYDPESPKYLLSGPLGRRLWTPELKFCHQFT